MSNKKEIDKSIIDNYVMEINNGKIKREQVLQELSISPRTWTTKVEEAGWEYDKVKSRYVKKVEKPITGQMTILEINAVQENKHKDEVPAATSDANINEDIEQSEGKEPHAGRPQIQRDEPLIKRTFLITASIDKALRLKAANEGKGINEIVREIFNNAIEPKYFKGL